MSTIRHFEDNFALTVKHCTDLQGVLSSSKSTQARHSPHVCANDSKLPSESIASDTAVFPGFWASTAQSDGPVQTSSNEPDHCSIMTSRSLASNGRITDIFKAAVSPLQLAMTATAVTDSSSIKDVTMMYPHSTPGKASGVQTDSSPFSSGQLTSFRSRTAAHVPATAEPGSIGSHTELLTKQIDASPTAAAFTDTEPAAEASASAAEQASAEGLKGPVKGRKKKQLPASSIVRTACKLSAGEHRWVIS